MRQAPTKETRSVAETCTRRDCPFRTVIFVVLKLAALLLLTLFVAAVSAPALPSSATSTATSCGGEHRWAVKTLSDADADKVHYDTPKRKTIHYLLTREDPGVHKDTPRDPDGKHVELTVYHLVAVHLVEARIEEDGDIHLVIRNQNPDNHMIVEFPSTLCKGASVSAHKAEMEQARTNFATLCGLPTWATRVKKAAPKQLSGWASLEGVGFFDLPHSTPQSGVAPNNIELHPVLQFSAENCHVT